MRPPSVTARTPTARTARHSPNAGPPAFGECLAVLAVGVRAVTDGGRIVQERVDPYVQHLRGVPRHLDAPVERRARDRKVAKVRRDEGNDLVAGAGRLHEVGVGLCLLYTSDAADDLLCVDLGGRR